MRKLKFLGTTVLQSAAFVSALVFASPALAQDAAASQDTTVPVPSNASPGEAQAEATLPETAGVDCRANPNSSECATIVVTGSRIKQRAEFTSPDPVAVIDPVLAQKEGKLDTASMLQTSPIAAGSTQITSAISSNFVTNGGQGAQTLNLRGLGANRTLILLNGRRAGPAGTRGGVSSFDLNVLPQSIVQSVEILKTGASSIYGSDAIAGVVNLLTKTDTKGVQLDMNVSVPVGGGGEQYRISAIYGKDFGRGHFTFGVDYFKQKELARGDRKYLACPEAYIFEPSGGGRADLVDTRTGNAKCEDLRWGHVWTYDLIGNLSLDGPGGPNTGAYTGPVSLVQYQYPGETLGIPAFGAPTSRDDFSAPAGWFPTGYDTASTAVQNSYHPFVDQQSLIPETERYTAYAEGSFDITDNVEVFGEFLFNRRKTYQNGWRQFWQFGYTSDMGETGDLYGYGADPFAVGFTGFNLISPTGITDQSDSSQKVDYGRGVGGFRGEFGKGLLDGWSWDVHAQYSRSNGKYRTQQILQEVYDVASFRTSSCVGTVLPISGRQCIDLPWTDPYFLRGELTQEQKDFIFDWEEGKTLYKQLSGEGILTGKLLDLPAGPLGIAFGVSVRRDSINDTPGDITLAANAWGASASGITAGRSITKEAFGEIAVPLLKDRPFFKDLSLSGAARITNVTATRASDGESASDNGNWTYKVGGNWAVNDWLRFRATYGTSYRAPALFELFLADETSFPRSADIDPCVRYDVNLASGRINERIRTNCIADGIPNNYTGGGITATAIASGGLGLLEAETSTAKTASIILTPNLRFLPRTRISLAVDYYDIVVKGEISQLGARNVIVGCYNSESFPTDPLCDLFTRGQTGAPFNIATVRDSYINIARQRNSGIDVTTNIRHNLGKAGTLNLLSSMTFQLKDTFALFADTETSNNGEIGDPKWVGDFKLSYQSRNGWNVFYGVDVIGKASNEKDFIEDNGDLCPNSPIYGEYCVKLKVPRVFYHSASVTKSLNKFDFTVGMNNIFDKRPPRVSVLNGGEVSMIGPVVATSQYGFLGRRAFVNVTTRF